MYKIYQILHVCSSIRSIRSINLFHSICFILIDLYQIDLYLYIYSQMVTSVSLSYRQFLYTDLYRSMFHLNWPVMESDL